jgi:hypothetical protein
MRALALFVLAFLGGGAVVGADVPCNVFGHSGYGCPNPIVQGVVDGQWVALIYHYDGTNGGPDSIAVVSIGTGGNGFLTGALQVIKAEGQYGDRMEAQFIGGKLWVKNAVYLPGEPHCCNSHLAVRQYGFHDRRLAVEEEASVPVKATESQVRAALQSGMKFY